MQVVGVAFLQLWNWGVKKPPKKGAELRGLFSLVY